jgi:dTDP-4-amino-4,6-dideoxygalactose transaminase
MIRLFQPTLGREELKAIAEVFADQWPGNGPRVKAFEQDFAEYISVEAKEMIAVTSCTEGLFQSIAALELNISDEVILPTISFVGAAHAVSASGAKLRLVDVDSETLNPRTEDIDRAITPETKAILLLHFGGRLDWIEEIAELAKNRHLVLIEDSACALGGKRNGKSYGTFGDVGVWSFDSMKLLVTGDGGMIRVRNEDMRTRIFNRVHLGGVRPGVEGATGNKERWWEVNPVCWGRLAFMNDLAAAIGQVQLTRLAKFIERRKLIAEAYDNAFAGISWLRLPPPRSEETIPYFYWIQTPKGIRDRLANYLRDHEIYTTFRYWPLHRTQLYRDSRSFPGADLATNITLLLPIHQNLSDSDVDRIIGAIKAFKQ